MNIVAGQLPEINNIVLIGFNQEYVAFLSDNNPNYYTVYVFSIDLQPKLEMQEDIRKNMHESNQRESEKSPQRLLFMSDECIAVVFHDHLLLVQKDNEAYDYALNEKGFLIR